MKNTPYISVLVLAVSMFMMMAPMAQGMGSILSGTYTDRGEIMPSATVGQNLILLAAGEEETAGVNPQGATVSDDQVSEAGAVSETDNKESSAKSKPAPLKSFKPSEEIAAEQAVDFPVDI